MGAGPFCISTIISDAKSAGGINVALALVGDVPCEIEVHAVLLHGLGFALVRRRGFYVAAFHGWGRSHSHPVMEKFIIIIPFQIRV